MTAVVGQSRTDKSKGHIAKTYDYTDSDGTVLYQVVRYEPKDFRQRQPDGNGAWIWKLPERRVPYRWPELLQYPSGTVFVTEGEKDADRVAAHELCATTVAGGKWTDDCVAALAGRDIYILEDNDDAGRKKALAAAQALHGTAASIRIVSLPGLPDKGDVSDWLDADPHRAKKLAEVCYEAPTWVPPSTATDVHVTTWKYHADTIPDPPAWLIKGIFPETGAALMSGQWGTFKTTIALDISVCVMADLLFANQYRVKRRGAVLYFALEGEGMVHARLSAIAAHHGVTGPLPFAWRGECPALMDKNAANALCSIVNEAAIDLKRQFNVPVSLILVDTLITAAGFAAGEDSDSAAAQRVMNALRITSQRTGALVVGIDHFGKVVEAGTRGSSAKESAADAVIALLAERELGGSVKNTRLAMRKQRDGVSGFEIPFMARIVETGRDADGDPITAPVIDWQATQQPSPGDGRLAPTMELLRRVLTNTLLDIGKPAKPFPDGPLVSACDLEPVRSEFYRQYPADGTDKQKSDARRQAFNRAVKASQAMGLVAIREVDDVQLIWLAKPEPSDV